MLMPIHPFSDVLLVLHLFIHATQHPLCTRSLFFHLFTGHFGLCLLILTLWSYPHIRSLNDYIIIFPHFRVLRRMRLTAVHSIFVTWSRPLKIG
ncbi:hypothetical protein K435DRAFT_504712 [Dendrothele bispora CBS 962.96]|uniref:Uncharacterized protein n=1 Tax=Dendrothele bispora (strain CBS 962.96) TaxID=1314807 RepID=A0A4S8KW75_DENBC|nr:hypothetical protein K435DRAFT_504712 [Dendrothele bispora CBS 962.96]